MVTKGRKERGRAYPDGTRRQLIGTLMPGAAGYRVKV